MKKLIFSLLVFLTLSINAQDFESVKFMGIPVNGTKENMISQLEQKGFKYDAKSDYLDGKFNGEDAIIYVGTNKDVVDRIMVTYINPISETDIKIKFNRLVRQFENNEKYFSLLEDQSIDDDVDISYDISIKKKRFQASYHQCYTKAEIDALKTLINDNYETFMDNFAKSSELKESGLSFDGTREENINAIAALMGMAYMMKNDVWFMISESKTMYNHYMITMFYDNLSNRPNGEDL